MVMHTGPVLPPGPVHGNPIQVNPPGGNQSVGSSTTDRFMWATVIQPSPLTIQLDGDTTPLPLVPDSLVATTGMVPYTRVWVQLSGRRVIVLGVAGGDIGWVDVPVLPGFAARSAVPLSDFTPQVMLDASGLVHFRGMMSNTGLTSMTADTAMLQLPDGYWPNTQQWWVGFSGNRTSVTYGGYADPSSGLIIIRHDPTSPAPSPPTYFSITMTAWMPIPAAPY